MEYFQNLYQKMVIADGHCDSILDLYKSGRSFFEGGKIGHLDWPRLTAAKMNLQFLAFYIEPQYKPYGALCRLCEIFAYYLRLSEKKKLNVVLNRSDLASIRPESECHFLLAIEGGEVLENQLSTLSVLFQLGFRSLTLTWNQRNSLADGVWEDRSGGGLTEFGGQVVREMNRLGMMIDVSHLSAAGFWDVLALSEKPVAATHSCCASLYQHPRNLSDSQLIAISKAKGLVGINFYPGFLGEGEPSINDVLAHIEHAALVAGVDCVGIGSDFDGINSTPVGLENVSKLPRIAEALFKKGWHEEDVRKIMGGNFLRVLQEVLPNA